MKYDYTVKVIEAERLEIHEKAFMNRRQSDDEYIGLKNSIASIGQRDPIWVQGNKVIDGVHRRRAIIELGIGEVKAFSIPEDMTYDEIVLQIIASENRRKKTPSELAIDADRYYITRHEAGDKITRKDCAILFGAKQSDLKRISYIKKYFAGAVIALDIIASGNQAQVNIGGERMYVSNLAFLERKIRENEKRKLEEKRVMAVKKQEWDLRNETKEMIREGFLTLRSMGESEKECVCLATESFSVPETLSDDTTGRKTEAEEAFC